jgi:hypothetical protein
VFREKKKKTIPIFIDVLMLPCTRMPMTSIRIDLNNYIYNIITNSTVISVCKLSRLRITYYIFMLTRVC